MLDVFALAYVNPGIGLSGVASHRDNELSSYDWVFVHFVIGVAICIGIGTSA